MNNRLTALEVAYRQQEANKLLGAAYARLQEQLIVPLLRRAVEEMNDETRLCQRSREDEDREMTCGH